MTGSPAALVQVRLKADTTYESMLRALSALAIVATAFGCSQRNAAPRGSVTISLIGTNDLHGSVLSVDGQGGLALFDGFLRNLRTARSADGGAVLLVDAGDLFQGTLESNLNEGAVVVAAYNALGYTASAVGNHEFDFGPAGKAPTPESPNDDPRGALKARASEAHFPFLAANIIDETTGQPVQWPNVKASTIVDVAGIRVGLVGLTTTATLSVTMAANTRGLAIAPLASTLEAEAGRLRQAGATVIVATAHAGGRCEKFDNPADVSSCSANAEIFDLARAMPPGLVDAIVAGHRHEGIAHEVAGVPIISSYTGGRAFGRIDLVVDRSTGRVQSHHVFQPQYVCARHDAASGSCVPVTTESSVPAQYEGRAVQPSAQIDSILAPAVEAARAFKEKRLSGTVDSLLKESDTEESALGNLIADWMRATVAGADAAIANGGGLRADLPPGPLTYGGLFGVTPFDNRLTLITLTGAELGKVVSQNLQKRGSIVVLSGVRAAATCDGNNVGVSLRRVSGRAVGDGERLRIVTSDFLATGGDDILTPVMPLRVPALFEPAILRDLMADRITRTGGTWRQRDLLSPSNRRLVYSGSRPVRCN